MSETYPPEGDQGRDVPPVQTATSQPPAVPPTGPPVATMTPPPPPGPRPKRKLDWPFAILGFLASPVLLVAASAAAAALSRAGLPVSFIGSIGGLLQVAVVIAAIAAFVVGTRRENNRLRSFAVGALWSFVAYMLIALLAFGACLITLTGNNGLFGG